MTQAGDLPRANNLMPRVYAAMAQKERELIGERTRAALAERVIRNRLIDLAFLGRAALANPHWPVWAARERAHDDPFSLLPQNWSWWLRNRPGSGNSRGWPAAAAASG